MNPGAAKKARAGSPAEATGPADARAAMDPGRQFVRGTSPADWDAGTYSRVSTPQQDWSKAVLDRLELDGDETVLDAGCGSGDVTAELLERLPRGRVIAVDGSPSMVKLAAARLPAGRSEVICSDLTELQIDGGVDHAFSNAVFHWVGDHDRLFPALHRALRPGGRLVAQCGGRGNVARAERALGTVCRDPQFSGEVSGFESPWNFAGPAETEARLKAAGFDEAECWLEEQTARPEEPRAFLQASMLAQIKELLDDEKFEAFTDRMMSEMGDPGTFQYVRLNIVAERT
jgi:trans-aconitate 2-methyltransferase